MAANRPHFHVWRLAKTGRIFYQVARGFHTGQAARQWASRYENAPDRYMLRQCLDETCTPQL